MARLGDVPEGTVLDVAHTSDLKVGDRIYITFPAGKFLPPTVPSAGYLKYGPEVTLVVASKTPDGGVILRDSSGPIPEPLIGTRDEILQKFGKLSRFDNLIVVRPPEGKEGESPWNQKAFVHSAGEKGQVDGALILLWTALFVVAAVVFGRVYVIHKASAKPDKALEGAVEGWKLPDRLQGLLDQAQPFIGQSRACHNRRGKRRT